MGGLWTILPGGGFSLIYQNPYLLGVASVSPLSIGKGGQSYPDYYLQFSTLGGLLFGYDQGVISGVITMESFGARFPHIYTDSSFKGWFVSTLLLGTVNVLIFPSKNNTDALLAAWFGSLINGPIADRLGRKLSINLAVVVFVIGSAIQCGAVTIPMLFAGMFHHLQDTSRYLIACRESYRRSGGWSVDHGGAFVHLRGMHPHLTEEGEE